jgi:hypothetical protein
MFIQKDILKAPQQEKHANEFGKFRDAVLVHISLQNFDHKNSSCPLNLFLLCCAGRQVWRQGQDHLQQLTQPLQDRSQRH